MKHKSLEISGLRLLTARLIFVELFVGVAIGALLTAGIFLYRVQYDSLRIRENTYHAPLSLNLGKTRPSAGSKVSQLLEPGQIELDLDLYYAKAHKHGWTEAFSDFRKNGEFRLKSYEDCVSDFADFETGYRGFWRGYEDAAAEIRTSGHRSLSVPP